MGTSYYKNVQRITWREAAGRWMVKTRPILSLFLVPFISKGIRTICGPMLTITRSIPMPQYPVLGNIVTTVYLYVPIDICTH